MSAKYGKYYYFANKGGKYLTPFGAEFPTPPPPGGNPAI